MGSSYGHTTRIQRCLDRLRAGDDSAHKELINQSCERLRRLAHRMLASSPDVRRWEETDDVLQNASMRLCRALADVKPSTVREFIGLAALQIRRELSDLARHYMGPQGMGAHHQSDGVRAGQSESASPRYEAVDDTAGPSTLAEWTDFHRFVEQLPPAEREVLDLHYYGGLSHGETAEALDTSERTVKRRWQSAILLLHEALKGDLPGD